MPYASIIISLIGTGIKLLGSAGGPNYPATPKLAKLPVQDAKNFMEAYERERMGASIGAWQARYPLLYKGGGYMVDDLIRNQQGKLSKTTEADVQSSGLETAKGGNQLALSKDLGLSPIALSQRTSSAVSRNIAMNPEWTDQISGGTLATLLANANANQNAYNTFLGAANTQQFISGQAADSAMTRTLLTGLAGAGGVGYQAYQNANSPYNLSSYYQSNLYNQSSQQPYQQPPQGYSTVGPLSDVTGPPGQVSVGAPEDISYNNTYATGTANPDQPFFF